LFYWKQTYDSHSSCFVLFICTACLSEKDCIFWEITKELSDSLKKSYLSIQKIMINIIIACFLRLNKTIIYTMHFVFLSQEDVLFKSFLYHKNIYCILISCKTYFEFKISYKKWIKLYPFMIFFVILWQIAFQLVLL
jgi:hypothetical protein